MMRKRLCEKDFAKIMTRKASPSVLLHKSEVTYRDTGVSKNCFLMLIFKISGVNKETGRRFTSREIKSISKDVEVNKGVWEIAERIASIKEPTYQIAA